MSDEEKSTQETNLWPAFVDYLNENYYPGVLEDLTQEIIYFQWSEFAAEYK